VRPLKSSDFVRAAADRATGTPIATAGVLRERWLGHASAVPQRTSIKEHRSIMKAYGTILKSACIALSTLSITAACSDAQSTSEDEQVELADDQLDEIGELSLALNSDTNCGTASADKTYTSIISPSFTSSNTYTGRNGCGKAFFVRVDNYRSGNITKFNQFVYAGAEPSTAAGCRDTRLMVYAFERKADGTAVFVDNASINGQPDFFVDTGAYLGCTLPRFTPDGQCSEFPLPFALTVGKNYAFAVSARTNNAGDPVVQPIRMSSGDRLRCTPR
jgi:hypothetical protein